MATAAAVAVVGVFAGRSGRGSRRGSSGSVFSVAEGPTLVVWQVEAVAVVVVVTVQTQQHLKSRKYSMLLRNTVAAVLVRRTTTGAVSRSTMRLHTYFQHRRGTVGRQST